MQLCSSLTQIEGINKNVWHQYPYKIGKVHGDIDIFIKSRLKHDVLENYYTNCLQATSIPVTEMCDELTLSLIYYSPTSEIRPKGS